MVTQRQMHGLGRDVVSSGEAEQLTQQRLCGRRVMALDAKCITAAAHLDTEPRLDQAQIFVKRTTKIG
jgi:hypothetical protein